jgi:ATP-dependent DNA helicase RecQ
VEILISISKYMNASNRIMDKISIENMGSALDVLKRYFGYDEFRPLQAEIIERVVSGLDTLVLMPTGGGKSLCFQIPALLLPGVTIVVSPLISLMKDQVDSLVENGVNAVMLNSGMSPVEVSDAMGEVKRGKAKMLYIAPERLSAPGFKDFLKTLTISLFAIDEAHCISEWGHDFRPDYRNIKKLRKEFPSVPVVALTATATTTVRDDIIRELAMKEYEVFLSSFNRPNLSYEVRPKKEAVKTILSLLKENIGESCIVYCFSRKDTESITDHLKKAGYKAKAYHAGLSADVRAKNQDDFIHDKIQVMVATIAFGMGIDKPDVRLVVHHSLPKSIEGYYQETGRAGRDGLRARCVLLFSYADKSKQEYFIQSMSDAEQIKAEQNLRQVLGYGELKSCRRKFLLNYFDEVVSENTCDNCDCCTGGFVMNMKIRLLIHQIQYFLLRLQRIVGLQKVKSGDLVSVLKKQRRADLEQLEI